MDGLTDTILGGLAAGDPSRDRTAVVAAEAERLAAIVELEARRRLWELAMQEAHRD